MSFPDGGYSSHLEALAWAVAKTKGDIIEYGGGWYSTPFLHGISEAQGRRLYTVEQEEWMYGQLAQAWASDLHVVTQTIYGLPKKPGLVFVDTSTSLRGPYIASSRKAKLVVVHDTEPESEENYPGMHEALARFKYRRDWTTFQWHTTAVSNTMEL